MRQYDSDGIKLEASCSWLTEDVHQTSTKEVMLKQFDGGQPDHQIPVASRKLFKAEDRRKVKDAKGGRTTVVLQSFADARDEFLSAAQNGLAGEA